METGISFNMGKWDLPFDKIEQKEGLEDQETCNKGKKVLNVFLSWKINRTSSPKIY